ncbi:hypothetical protein [Enterococcus casseliflavus]|uniref:hypothetical protein n=1 Tax=Enterococcus casseliflavus TaxID=37734 RepID=UPI0006843C4C|nr:hypothetical protein [Enterococcus casseliflavus]
MDYKKKIGTWYLLLVLLIMGLSSNAQATSVQSADTEGSIQFTGRYEPIGTPDPPPSNITKPPVSGELPQTNTVTHYHWVWLGWLFVVLAGIIVMKSKTKTIK